MDDGNWVLINASTPPLSPPPLSPALFPPSLIIQRMDGSKMKEIRTRVTASFKRAGESMGSAGGNGRRGSRWSQRERERERGREGGKERDFNKELKEVACD